MHPSSALRPRRIHDLPNVNLKLKRLVRTSSSEQYALFDLDQLDSERQPTTIGKLDLHYTGEGMYGTLLLWDESMRQLRPDTRRDFIHALLGELSQPMGVPSEYVVEFFTPTLAGYEVIHNVEVNDGASAGESSAIGPAARPDTLTTQRPTLR